MEKNKKIYKNIGIFIILIKFVFNIEETLSNSSLEISLNYDWTFIINRRNIEYRE